MTMLPQIKSPTFKVVGGLIGAALIWAAWTLFNPWWAAFATTIALYEGWTLINKYKNDTLSEIIWALNERPLVPYMFGAATAAMIENGVFSLTVSGVYSALIWGFLCGHFFFQRKVD